MWHTLVARKISVGLENTRLSLRAGWDRGTVERVVQRPRLTLIGTQQTLGIVMTGVRPGGAVTSTTGGVLALEILRRRHRLQHRSWVREWVCLIALHLSQ